MVDLSAKPTTPRAQTSTKQTSNANETALELGGGALALLALGGAAFAIASRRRRRRDEEAWNYEHLEPAAEEGVARPRHDPVAEHEPPIVAPEPSAFAWGNAQPAPAFGDDGSDRRPGESWVERAYRGPSPANPSVSLRARLKRAAFFDKREREVAAGKAEPVETDAGLPEAMVEEQEAEREVA